MSLPNAAAANASSTTISTADLALGTAQAITEISNLIEDAINRGKFEIRLNLAYPLVVADVMTYFQGLGYTISMVPPFWGPWQWLWNDAGWENEFNKLPWWHGRQLAVLVTWNNA